MKKIGCISRKCGPPLERWHDRSYSISTARSVVLIVVWPLWPLTERLVLMAQVASLVRERQAPLRAAYAEHPEDAVTHKHATTHTEPGLDCLHGIVKPGEGFNVTWRTGIDRTVGGDHDGPNPGDVLCAALASCMDGMVRMVADIMAIDLTDVSVEVDGEVDVRGTMAIDPTAPVGFRSMRCTVHLPGCSRHPATPDRRFAFHHRTPLRQSPDIAIGRSGRSELAS